MRNFILQRACKIFLTLFLVIALALAGCGFHHSTRNVSQTENPAQATVDNQKHAASFADFRNALKSAGYLEINVLKTKYADAIAADGLSGQSLREAAKADGVIGAYTSYNTSYHNTIDSWNSRYPTKRGGVRQYTQCVFFELDLLEDVEMLDSTGVYAYFCLFDDEEYAAEFVTEQTDLSEFESGGLSISEDAGENYSKVVATSNFEGDSLKACVSRVENTVLMVGCPADYPVYNIVDILGY